MGSNESGESPAPQADSTSTSRRTEHLWRLTLVAGVLAGWIGLVLLPSPVVRPDFGAGDLFSYFLPAYAFVGERLRHGAFAWWNPYTGGGVPLAATLQPGALYPARLLLLGLDADQATHVSLVAHLVLAALATAALARTWGASRWGATAAAAVFVVPAELPHLYFPPYLEAGAWLPVAGLAITRLFGGGSVWWSAALGLALGLPVVAGGYQTALLVAYGSAVVSFAELAAGTRRLPWRTCVVRFAIAGLIAVATAAPQLGCTLAWTAETVRTTNRLTDAQIQPYWTPALMGFLAREVLRQTVLSNGGLQTLYLSGPAVFLMLLGFIRGGRRGAVIAGATAVFYLLTFGPGFPWFALYHWLPALSWFRLPQRLSFLVAFFGALGVGLGTTAARRLVGPRAEPWCDAGIAVAVLAALLVPARNNRAIPWTLPAAMRITAPDAFDATAAAVGDGRVSIQTQSPLAIVFPRLGLERHVRMLEDYEPLSSRRLQALLRAAGGQDAPIPPDAAPFTGTVAPAVARPVLLDVAAVTAIVTTGIPPAVAAWTSAGRPDGLAVLRNPDPLPRAHLSPGVRYVATEAEALQLLASGAHDPRRSAVLVGGPDNGADAVPGSGAIVSLIVVEEAPELVRVDLPQDGRGVVVLADAWAPGWSALVDGKPRRLWQANYFGRGVLVHPGDHTIEFRYEPPGVRSGAYIALASLAAAALLARTRAAKGS